jgi:cephalosporin-C deacetylase
VSIDLLSDTKQPIYSYSQFVSLHRGQSNVVNFEFDLKPGFYRCTLAEKDLDYTYHTVQKFNIAFEPEEVVSIPNPQPDLKEFWDKAKRELAQVLPDYKITSMEDPYNLKYRKLYKVSMKSLGGVEIQGYYTVPARMSKNTKYPAIIHYMGYGSQPWVPGGSSETIEFVLSVRNQALLEDVNRTDQWSWWTKDANDEITPEYNWWICEGLKNKEDYYYRGAFMDLIRAIDFIASRKEVDIHRIYAEGASQGGAFTLAAAALDNRLCAIAPSIPFLSDYANYFKIVDWPGSWLMATQHKLGISDEDFYKTLSYFDMKNLAVWITCPTIMGVGLQDETCPPHKNFASYNLINARKSYKIYRGMGHSTGTDWWDTYVKPFWGLEY